MIIVRPASSADKGEIYRILEEADLHHLGEQLDNFYVAVLDGKIVGIVRLEEHSDFIFLSSLGVANDQRDKGIASALLKQALTQAHKPIYLYTIIPDFFRRFGFAVADSYPQLPDKKFFDCGQCCPGCCLVMVRQP